MVMGSPEAAGRAGGEGGVKGREGTVGTEEKEVGKGNARED